MYVQKRLFLLLFILALFVTGVSAQGCGAGFRLFTHAMGETCIPENPQRVVVLDTGELDNALALGAPVVGAPVTEAQQYQEYLADQLGGIADTGAISEPNLEAILAMSPDLILGSKQRYEAIYEQLSEIAPTALTASLRVPWQDNFRFHADALGKTAEGEQLLAEYDAHVAEVQAVLGDVLDSTTISIIRFRPGQVRLYLKSSYIGYILQDIGLRRPASQNEDVFSKEISLEQVQDVDADYIFITGYAPDDSDLEKFLNSPLWQTLNAVQNGRAIDVNDDTWIAGLGIQSANLVLDDLVKLLACESGFRAVTDAAGQTICVPQNPQRVVALMESDLDALLALGIQPIGTTNGRGQPTPPRYLDEYLDGIEVVGAFYNPNLESVLALDPDLILFGGFNDADVLAQLNAIAPTVNTFMNGESWKSHLLRVGEVMNMPDKAQTFIDEYESRVEDIKSALGDNAAAEFIVARWSADGPQVMAPTTFSSTVLLDLGLTAPAEIPDLQPGHPHSAPLSLETLDVIDVDWAFVGTLSGVGDAVDALNAALENPLYQALRVVQNDHLVLVDGSLWTSIGGPIAAMRVLDDVEAALIKGE